jgi:hypothetical protein
MTSLHAQLISSEQRVAARRGALCERIRTIRRQAIAPATLVGAVAIGVLVERSSRDGGGAVVRLWRAATLSTALLRSLGDFLDRLDAPRAA